MTDFRSVPPSIIVALLLGAALLPGLVAAQAPAVSLTLDDARFELDRLAPGITSGEATFLIDQAGVLEFDISATIDTLTTSILAPTGEVVDEISVTGLGGEFAFFEGAAGNDSALISSVGTPGFHYHYRFPSLGPGTYTARFSAATLTDETPVFTRLRTDSALVVGLLAPDPEVVLGDLAVLTAAVFEGAQAVAGATVTATIRDPNGQYQTIDLLDDGVEADDSAGDGLYSGEIEPALTGSYSAVGRITGSDAAGNPFERQAAADFSVIPNRSRLTGNFMDSGVDDTGNGLFDRLAIELDTDTAEAGSYRLYVELRSAGGGSSLQSTEAALPVGPGSVEVNFPAAAIQELGEDGPYEVAVAELVFFGPAGASSADRLLDLGQTQAYTLSQFQRPGIALTGTIADQGIDDDGNGRFDRLVVDVEVDLLNQGFYGWSFKLTDQDAQEIDFASNSGFLSAGLNNIRVTFDGLTIGDSRIDGPYLLRDLLMFGAGTSLVRTDLGETAAYLARQFESSNLPPVADAGPDRTVECTGPSGAEMTLDGTGSSDPDGDPLTFSWNGPFGLATGPTPTVEIPFSTHVITLTVDDGRGESDTDTVEITVVDTTAPAIASLSPDPSVLWPPNHGMVPVVVDVLVTDLCDPTPACRIVGVASDEPVTGGGTGNTAPDWVITGALTVDLRAERSGGGDGRTYSITVECTDASGNAEVGVATVEVPHDQGL